MKHRSHSLVSPQLDKPQTKHLILLRNKSLRFPLISSKLLSQTNLPKCEYVICFLLCH